MGFPQISIIGLGISLAIEAILVPFPPAIITTFIVIPSKNALQFQGRVHDKQEDEVPES